MSVNKMMRIEYTKGFEGYQKFIQELYKDNSNPLYIYFTAERDEKGVSWCSNCNAARPIFDDAVVKFARAQSTLLVVEVGDTSFWKDMNNPFRNDPNLKLKVIPTLLRWKSVIRLELDQCTKLDLFDMFFNEE